MRAGLCAWLGWPVAAVKHSPRDSPGTFLVLHPPGLNQFLAVGYKISLFHSNLMRCLKRGFNHGIKVMVTALELGSANTFPEQTALLHPY